MARISRLFVGIEYWCHADVLEEDIRIFPSNYRLNRIRSLTGIVNIGWPEA